MRFKDVFSIIGPVMIGPSSSHTAGAVLLGRVARSLLGAVPSECSITLYGSFAETYQGHGTDLALIGGLLDMDTDDPRIPISFELAASAGLTVRFRSGVGATHPNMALLKLSGGGKQASVRGASIGGGNIAIDTVDGFDVKFSGLYPTLVLRHYDRPGVVADITGLLSREGINIGHMTVDRKSRSGEAMTVIETDERVSDPLWTLLTSTPDVKEARRLHLAERSPR